MDCLNSEFPLNTEMPLAAMQNLSYNTQWGCKLVCTAVEQYDPFLGGPTPWELFFDFLTYIFIVIVIFIALGLMYQAIKFGLRKV